MPKKLNEPVSVSLVYDSKVKKSTPRSIVWNNRIYRVTKLGLHHTYKKGNNLYHIFSVVASTLFFRLILDTTTLHWKLEEVEDSLIS